MTELTKQEHKYIGEKTVDIKNTPFKNHTPLDWALEYITRYGGSDGGHHKQWVLDQVARILNGTPVTLKEAKWTNPECSEYRFDTGKPSKKYLEWVKEYENGEDGEHTYSYDEGVAP